MLKNKLSQILAAVALGCITAGAGAQMGYTSPMMSGRWGGALVSGFNIGYYSYGISRMAMPVNGSYGFVSPSAFNSPGAIVVRRFPPLPADGTKMPLAFQSSGTPVIVRPFPPLPADGTKIPLAFQSSGGPVIVRPFPPLPANGMKIPLSRGR